MLAQTGLLNSTLLKQINSAGNMSQNVNSQLMDSLNQLNPNMKKKLGVDQALSNLTSGIVFEEECPVYTFCLFFTVLLLIRQFTGFFSN